MGKYKTPSLTADIFIFDDDENFILIKRKNEPYKDYSIVNVPEGCEDEIPFDGAIKVS